MNNCVDRFERVIDTCVSNLQMRDGTQPVTPDMKHVHTAPCECFNQFVAPFAI